MNYKLIFILLIFIVTPFVFADEITKTSSGVIVSIASDAKPAGILVANNSTDLCVDDCKIGTNAITTKGAVSVVATPSIPNSPIVQDLGVIPTASTAKLRGIRIEGDTVYTTNEIRVEDNKIFIETEEGPREVSSDLKAIKTVAIAQTGITEIRNTNIELENAKAVYTIEGVSEKKLFGLVPVAVPVQTKIDAETQEVKNTHKPWWAFFAR